MKKEIREYMSNLGKRSASKLTKQQRIARARAAVRKRWLKSK